MNRTLVGIAFAALGLSFGIEDSWAVVGASGSGGPTTTTIHSGNQSGFTINENVFFNPAAGRWIKRLGHSGPGIDSGRQVPIIEELTNTGALPWTDWHEDVVGPVEDFGFGPATEFAFERNSVSVRRNGINLVQGVDYTLTFTEHPINQPMQPGGVGPGHHWQGFSLFFNPASVIGPTDVLRIQKNIFETYLNATPWNFMLVAEIAEYPTVPEPAAIGLAVTAAGVVMLRRRGNRGWGLGAGGWG